MSNNKRSVNGFGRSVVIELSHLSDAQLSQIGKTLSNLILLSNQLIGSQRITYFKLELIGSVPNVVIPLLYIKSNIFLNEYFDKLNKLTQFRSYDNNLTHISKNIELTLRRVLSRLNHEKPEDINSIEITYISGRHEKEVIEDICQVLTKLDFNQITSHSSISMINIVCLSSDPSLTRPQLNDRPIICGPSSSSAFVEFKIPEEFEALIETKTILDSELAIEGYFKVWFHDSNFESEKIHISTGNTDNSNNGFIIKCDIREAILDVNLIPVIKTVKFDLCRTATIPPSILINNNKDSVYDECYELKIIGLVDREGLCDSVVFGIPYVLSPTRCHNLSFEELEQNTNQFHALIEVMNEKKVILILEHFQQSSPNSYFALFSSPDKKTLIMKSVATKELLLPYSNDSVDKLMSNNPKQQIIDSVRKQLDELPLTSYYNPLFVNNNLYEYLSPDGSHDNSNNKL